MGFLGKEFLLTRQKLDQVKVDLGNGDYVFVREMTGRERDAFEQSLSKEVTGADGKPERKSALEDFRAKLAVCALCDENGNSILEMKDFPTLSKSIGIRRLEKIVSEAQKLNKITEEDKEKLTKNSDAVPDGDSNSGSV